MDTPPATTPRTPPAHLADGRRLERAYPADITLAKTKETGTIEGYASVFNVVDSYGEVILPGAFARTIAAWEAKGKPVPVLWQHDTYDPIGATLELAEDDHGLRIKARLLVDDVAQAREAHALAAANVLGGLSIGFSIPRKGANGTSPLTYDEARDVWTIAEVKLWEYSLVTFPANEEATIDVVKAAGAALREATEAAAALAATTSATHAAAVEALRAQVLELRAIVDGRATASDAARINAQAATIRDATRLLRE